MIKVKAQSFRRSLDEDEKDAFAYELALGYFDQETLRQIFKLHPLDFESYLASDDIQTRKAVQQRLIDESPNALRIQARRAARIAIDEYSRIVTDEDAPAKTRMAAGQHLREFAFAVDRESLNSKKGGEEGGVIVKTNLDMGEEKGVYTLTATEVNDQLAENAVLSGKGEEDFSHLIGEAP